MSFAAIHPCLRGKLLNLNRRQQSPAIRVVAFEIPTCSRRCGTPVGVCRKRGRVAEGLGMGDEWQMGICIGR